MRRTCGVLFLFFAFFSATMPAWGQETARSIISKSDRLMRG